MNNKELYLEMLKVHIKLHAFATCLNEEMVQLQSLIESMDSQPIRAKKRQKTIEPDDIIPF